MAGHELQHPSDDGEVDRELEESFEAEEVQCDLFPQKLELRAGEAPRRQVPRGQGLPWGSAAGRLKSRAVQYIWGKLNSMREQ